MAPKLRKVRVEYRPAGGGKGTAWMVEIDPAAQLNDLLPELLPALNLTGSSDDYQLRSEGSINEPILVLTDNRSRIGAVEQIDIRDE